MHYIRFALTAFGMFASVFAGSFCAAQDAQGPANYPAKIVPQATETASPFAVNAQAAQISNSIAFLGPEAMSSADLQAVNGAMPAIQGKAALAGFNLAQGKWSYQQIVCPVIPDHLLLLYSRNDGAGDNSAFSVTLARDGSGVRVLPILHRGFALYTPAPMNPLSMAAFNRLRENDHSEKKPDWLVTGLCYAALTGSHVELVPPDTDRVGGSAIPAMSPLLEIDEGMNIVHFVDVEKIQAPQEWDLTFDPKGKLVKVAVTALPSLRVKMLP
jgi:hypothetical protein